MAEAMNAITDKQGLPITKIHGLRMLNVDVFTKLPLASADSTNIAQNVGIDSRWTGAYAPKSKSTRALIIRERIEAHQGLMFWQKQPIQMGIAA